MERRIIDMRRRIVSIVLIISIFMGDFFSCFIVNANSIADIEARRGYILVCIKYFLTQTFGLFTSDLDSFIANDERYQEYVENFYAKYDDKLDADGNLEVDKEDVENLFNITKDAMQALNGYYLLSTNFDKDAFYNQAKNSTSLSSSTSFYNAWTSLPDSFLVSHTGGKYNFFNFDDSSLYYLYGSAIVLLNGSSSFYSLFSISDTFGRFYGSSDIFTLYYPVYGYYGSPVKIFYTKLDLLEYQNQMPNAITSSNFNMPILSGNTVPINVADIEKTDWSAVNKSIYNATKEGVADGWASMDESERQAIIDQKMNDILGSLGEIGDNTGQSNALLSGVKDILNSINSKLSGIVTDFAETLKNQSTLLNLFKDFNYEKLLDVIKNSGGGGGGSLIGSTIGSVIGNLLSDLLDKIQNGDETVESVLEVLVDKFSGLANVSKTKFPFSLPWDMVAVFGVLAAEPQTPVFEFPIVIESIGFSYTIRMDLTDFEALSKLSRSFFVLIFSLMLIRLTLLMTVRGDFD